MCVLFLNWHGCIQFTGFSWVLHYCDFIEFYDIYCTTSNYDLLTMSNGLTDIPLLKVTEDQYCNNKII